MMSKGKSLFGRIFILSVLCHVCFSFAVANARFVDGHYVITDEDLMAKRSMDYVDREKRYTDTQERASAFCTGLCMFEEKKPYSYCFDLCNWNGKGPSPWDHHDRTKDSEASKAMSFPLNRSVSGPIPEGMLDTQKNLIRTGNRMRMGADRNKGRNRFAIEN